ncbi:MAG: exonuclease domain-containing protein [Pyrinomonadaceae bacterium]
MNWHRNLISDSVLVQETVELLLALGGSASVLDIADTVLRISNLHEELAIQLVTDVIRGDRRLGFRERSTVELLLDDSDAWLLRDTDFVVVDVETTGAKTPPGRITEIGAFRISRGQITDTFETLVNPQTPIPPFIADLTGITDDMVKTAPLFADIAHDWLNFADGTVLVAHNAAFDVRFLNHEIGTVFPGGRMSNEHLCTVKLSRSLFPTLDNHRLHTVAEHFAIFITNRHRAGGDARATAEVFLHMLEHLSDHGVHDLGGARSFKRHQRVAAVK